jgi:nitronate monooxygenase/enoyl-[acyl-carrier protein] reductase II
MHTRKEGEHMLKTALCRQLGIDYPIFSAGMGGGMAGPELVAKVFIQVGSVAEATAAAEAGVDAIIAQGMEAGGHVKSTTALSTIVPAVVEAVRPVPVIASGGIADGRGLVAALGLGAQAVSIGTRFLACEEAHVPREYKERVVRSTAEDTVYTSLFDVGWPDAPHRVLRNKAIAEWEAAGRPPTGKRPGEGTVIGTMPLGGTSWRW